MLPTLVKTRRILISRRLSSELIKKIPSFGSTRVALTDAHTSESFTYQDLHNAAGNMALELAKSIPKDCTAIGGFNKSNSSFVVAMLAAWKLKKVFVPLCSTHSESELNYFTTDSQLGAIVCSNKTDINPTFLSTLKIPLIETSTLSNLKHSPPKDATETNPSEPDWDALVIYTSGTTGKPKGVVHSSKGITGMITSLVQSWQYTSSDAILHFLPLYHVHGLVNKLLCLLWVGGRVEFLESGKAEGIWKRLADEQQHKPVTPLSLFMAVPTIYAKMLESVHKIPTEQRQAALQTIANLRLMVSGSAALPDSVMHRWRDLTGHTLLERYGMTEIGMALTNPYKLGERRMGTVGQPFPDVECRLVDDEGRDVHLQQQPNTAGELWIKGPTVFKRYLNLPQVTSDSFGEPGWFKTGDIAEVSPDGYFKILGRNSTDIIKSSGYKISALEIERELLDHPQVSEVAVIGVKDDVVGEKIVAVLSLVKDRQPSSPNSDKFPELHSGDIKALSANLKSFLSHRLALYKQPREFLLVDSIPRNHLGKREIFNYILHKLEIIIMSDTSFAHVSRKTRLIDIIGEDWVEDSLSDDEIVLPKEMAVQFNEEEEEDGDSKNEDSWSDLGIEEFVEQLVVSNQANSNTQSHGGVRVSDS